MIRHVAIVKFIIAASPCPALDVLAVLTEIAIEETSIAPVDYYLRDVASPLARLIFT